MALQAGIVGLPNVGKSTLFNAVSNSAKAQACNYRFCTIEPNVGLVNVPDPRLNKLEELVEQLEDGTIPLDKLAATVKQANEWVAVCEGKLRQIQEEVEADVVAKKSKGKK